MVFLYAVPALVRGWPGRADLGGRGAPVYQLDFI
jgi:hypothetical protein